MKPIVRVLFIICASAVAGFTLYFKSTVPVDVVRAHEIGTVFSDDEGAIAITQQKSNKSSTYEIYWKPAESSKQSQLLDVTFSFPMVGRLSDGRIWIIDSAAGDVNLRIQNRKGGWKAQHCNTENAAILALARIIGG